MPAVCAPAPPPATDTDRLQRLDAALRDMAETCPLPEGIQAFAERLDRMASLRGSRRRPRTIRRIGAA